MHRTYKQLMLNRIKQLHIFCSNSHVTPSTVGVAKGMVLRNPLEQREFYKNHTQHTNTLFGQTAHFCRNTR